MFVKIKKKLRANKNTNYVCTNGNALAPHWYPNNNHLDNYHTVNCYWTAATRTTNLAELKRQKAP